MPAKISARHRDLRLLSASIGLLMVGFSAIPLVGQAQGITNKACMVDSACPANSKCVGGVCEVKPLPAAGAAKPGTAPGVVYQDPAAYNMDLTVKDTNIPNIVNGIINRVLPLVGSLFLVMFVYAGGLWMTAGGDPKKVDSAKTTLRNSVIGITVVTMAYFIVNLLLGVKLG